MSRADGIVVVCPGSFDPITRGHEDIIRRSLRFASTVIVAVSHRPSQSKKGLFPVSERVEMIREIFRDEPRVEAADFTGLLVDFAVERGATLVVRGLRNVLDFEYEWQMSLMNRELAPSVDTVFLAPAADKSFVSSSLVREISSLGADVTPFVSEVVLQRIQALGRGRAD
jgi:pantetheine-phosphate adenylyltransferase